MTNPVSSKHILTSILKPLEVIEPPSQSTTTSTTTTSHIPHHTILSRLPDESQQRAKSILLTLHFLFPHEFLPALDLIDRRLINQLSVTTSAPSAEDESSPNAKDSSINVFYVQSASAASSAQNHGRFRNALSRANQFYEVRLDAWNCTCAAFAYSTLRLLMRDMRSHNHREVEHKGLDTPAHIPGVARQEGSTDAKSTETPQWLFGGSATKEDATIPICKHILAVTLVNSAPTLFGGGLMSKNASQEELAAWAAGWGEH